MEVAKEIEIEAETKSKWIRRQYDTSCKNSSDSETISKDIDNLENDDNAF